MLKTHLAHCVALVGLVAVGCGGDVAPVDNDGGIPDTPDTGPAASEGRCLKFTACPAATQCGQLYDGCGGYLNCGDCDGSVCNNGQCDYGEGCMLMGTLPYSDSCSCIQTTCCDVANAAIMGIASGQCGANGTSGVCQAYAHCYTAVCSGKIAGCP